MPATDGQTSIVTLDAPAMVRVSAKSGAGTSCTVVDKVRGPFESSGQTGRTNCELDLLLDIGSYKLRLESPHRGKGTVAITAHPFTEVNPKPVRLEKGRRVEQVLRSGEQASFWLSLAKREVPFLHLVGKNAGEVKLWRNGEWLEPITLQHTTFSAGLNRPVHEWSLDQMVEPGEYLVTAYGTKGLSGTSGEASDVLTVEYGFEPLPPERVVSFTLPATGTLSWRSPKGPGTFLLSLDESPQAPVTLAAGDLASPSYLELTPEPGKSLPPERGLYLNARFVLEPKKLVPQASATAGSDEVHVVNVRGAPGTRGLLEWAPHLQTPGWAGGYYGSAQRTLDFDLYGAADYLVGLHDLPADTDAAPLGCQLFRVTPKGREKMGHDVQQLADGQMLDREFNYDGSNEVLWFEVKRSDRYRLQTLGGRKNRCEVWRVDEHGELKRLTESKPNAKECNEGLVLTQGVYQLSLYDGLPGIEHVVVREDDQRKLSAAPAKAGCLLVAKGLEAGHYQLTVNRGGALAARGLVVQPLPLTADAPVHLVLDPGRTLKLPVSQAGVARAAANKSFECNGEKVAGQCSVPSGTFTVGNPSSEVISVTWFKPPQPRALPPLKAFDPKAAPLPKASLDQAVYFDFDRGQGHSLVFTVDKAGLYNVTTLGLLTTACRLRTPVVPAVAQDQSSGRGRNCLVQGYLRPGRYMLTATTVGDSRGRGGVVMTRRNPREFAAVGSDGEAFFRVAEGDLVQQKLIVRGGGQYTLSTSGQGVSLQCRLDDSDGWPLVTVPTSCSQTRDFAPGSYLWTQLPLTVESMRHTALTRVREATVLKGNKPHPVEFHTWYTAQLGGDGKDEFLFKLDGELSLDVVLTNGMQGRVYLLEPDKAPKPVEVIPAQQQPSNQGESEDGQSADGEGYNPDAYHPEPPEGEGEGEGEGGEGEGEGDAQPEYARPTPAAQRYQPLQARSAPAEATGVRITLPKGQYKLVTEHSRGDVGVQYQLHLSSEVMMPPMSRELPVPVVVPVKMPREGVLRLKTQGETDVRCRLFDGDRLVFEGADNGADWNCAVAEPLPAGDYRLVLESETQRPGNTRLSLALAPADDGGLAKDGATFRLASAVETFSLPVAEKDAVEEVSFRSRTPISCALEDGSGQVVHRQLRTTACGMLVRPQSERFKVRVWTTDGVASVTSGFRTKVVTPSSKGVASGAVASLVTLPRAGRYATSPQVYCLGGNQKGLLRSCGPQASLESGPAVFAVFGTKDLPLPLDEVTAATTANAASEGLPLEQRHWLEGLTAAKRSLFLLEGQVQHGERVSPACAFDTGVREARERSCFAVSEAGTQAIARAWAPVSDDTPLKAELTRRAIALPSSAQALVPGRSRLKLSGEGTLFNLPPTPRSRLELTLPGDAWAVLLDGGGKSLDFCAPVGPAAQLSRCVLTGKGGQLLVVSSDPQLEVTTVLLDVTEKSLAFTGLYEDEPESPGVVKLKAPASDVERAALVEGDGARCTFVFTDGTRVTGCKASVPKGVGVELQLEHGVGPLRAMLFAQGRERWARLGLDAPAVPGPSLSAALAVPVVGARMDRTLVLQKDAVVRVTSDSGVCGLLKGNDLLAVDGLGAGCELVRLVSAGTYRLLVRPFAGEAKPGALRWTSEPVVTLADGVGPEDWVAPSEVRVYRFTTASKGWVGLGVQTPAESLDCSIYDDGHRLLGDGCQQYVQLDKGSYLLTVRLPAKRGAQPLRFKPVLLGLAGASTGVPDEYLKDLFRRIGVNP